MQVVRNCRRMFPGLLILAFAAQAFPAAAMATTWYVRADGGSAGVCNGRFDAAASQAPDCAWSSPTVALPMGTDNYGNTIPTPLIHSGDTLVIAPGSYMIGYSATPIAGTQGQSCNQGSPYECAISNIPNGIDSAHPTVIRGASCSAKPELWGTQRNNSLIHLSGQHDVTLECMQITDHSDCIEFYGPDPAGACQRNQYPYGKWAATGIHADHVANLSLLQMDIHGLASAGINAGALSGNTMLDGVVIRANGWVGFNGDLGGNNQQSSNSGSITIQNSVIEWNGCTENWPGTDIIRCWAQQEGGYGDGLGTASTGGDWKVINTRIIGNTSDGLDLLYADGTGSVLVDRVVARWNAGNQIKTSGNATVRNSVVVGDCSYLSGWGAMSDGDLCRASGAALSMSVTAPEQTIKVLYNTVTGNGDCLINGGTHGGFSNPDSSDVYEYQNNAFVGAYYWRKQRNACLDWYTDDPVIPFSVSYTNNLVWSTKDDVCPAGSLCADPLLANAQLASFDPTPLPASSLIDAADDVACPATDQHGMARPQGPHCDIGAIEFAGEQIFRDGFEAN